MPSSLSALKHKFHVLDALRGIAAISVVIMHEDRFFRPVHLPHAYLAVDLFFCLSGFVLSYAYQERLDRGMPMSHWMTIRFVRLYPFYLLGLLLGATFAVVRMRAGALHMPVSVLVATLVVNLLMVPSLAFYPFDPASWSLLFVLICNVVHRLF